MVEQQVLDHGLGKIDQMVVAPQMTELVGQDQFELLARETEHHRGRKQDHRIEPAEQRRRVDMP